MVQSSSQQNFWLFQYGSSDSYERSLLANMRSGETIQSRLLRHREQTSAGDLVFFWQNDSPPGLIGWGEIAGPPGVSEGESTAVVPVLVKAAFSSVISRERVQELTELSDLTVIMQGRSGTNFLLSAEQAFAIAGLIRGTIGEEHPAPEVDLARVLSEIFGRAKRDAGRIRDEANRGRGSFFEMARERVEQIQSILGQTEASGDASPEQLKMLHSLAQEISGRSSAELQQKTSKAAFAQSSEIQLAAESLNNGVQKLGKLLNISLSQLSPAEVLPEQEEIKGGEAVLSDDGAERGVAETVLEIDELDEPDVLIDEDVDIAPAEADEDLAVPVEPEAADTEQPIAPPLPEPGQPEPVPAEPSDEEQEVRDHELIWAWREKDLIGIDQEVDNLARFICHQDLVPPMAIGVFGDWGSGKSFFMNAMKSEIALRALRSAQALRRDETSLFCSRIVQIDFNAWHYVESNLWASLAGHIFESLYNALMPDPKEVERREALDALYQNLHTFNEAKAMEAQIQNEINALEKERDLLQADLEQGPSQKELRREFFDLLKDELLKIVENEEQSNEIKKRISSYYSATQAEEIISSVDELREVSGKAEELKSAVSTELRTWGTWQYLAGFIITLLVVFAGPPAVRSILTFILEKMNLADVQVSAFLTQIGTYASAIALVISGLARRGSKLIGWLTQGNQYLTRARRSAEESKGIPIKAAERSLGNKEQELATVQSHITRLRAEQESLRLKLRGENAGTQLRNFLEDRVRNESYAKHLGLITMVRKDFDFFSGLLEEFWQTRNDPDPYREINIEESSLDTADPVEDAAAGEISEAEDNRLRIPFVERIVLYIDDLDRCPEEKVVEVLQAVHLLLGFKLFVVVVGVDVRWVGRALLKQYPELISADRGQAGQLQGWGRASADDYLEKIFQIPFRIPPMNAIAQRDFINGLMRQRFLGGWEREDETYTHATIELNPQESSLYPQEMECIEELHAALGQSPRRVKRFIDAYRLLRAGMSEGDVQSSLINLGYYRSILSMFAVLSGAPTMAPRFIPELFRKLSDPNSQVEFVNNGFDTNFELSKAPWNSFHHSERLSVQKVLTFLDNVDIVNRQSLIHGIVEWLPTVIRYSFREIVLAGDSSVPAPAGSMTMNLSMKEGDREVASATYRVEGIQVQPGEEQN